MRLPGHFLSYNNGEKGVFCLSLSETDTRAKLIDPAIHARGWTEDLVRREETAGAIAILDGQPRKQARGRVDYVLRVKVTFDSQPVAVALIEAKAEHLPPAHGLEQAKCYARCRRMNVPFVFSTNGHLFVEYDQFTGKTSGPKKLDSFPYRRGSRCLRACRRLRSPEPGGAPARPGAHQEDVRRPLLTFCRIG